MAWLSLEEFKKMHIEFLRRNNDPSSNPKWFNKILTERPRDLWFLSVLPSLDGLDVIDLCGAYGMFGAYLQGVKGLSFNYTCLDIDGHRIEKGPEYFRTFGLIETQFILHDVNDPLPLTTDSFDMVWLFGWCQARINCESLFREVCRVLRPRGHFIFNMAKNGTRYYTRYTKEGLLSLMDRTGFTVIRLDTIPNNVDFGVVARESVKDPTSRPAYVDHSQKRFSRSNGERSRGPSPGCREAEHNDSMPGSSSSDPV